MKIVCSLWHDKGRAGRMKRDMSHQEITLSMMRESLYSAVVCDALDGMGLTRRLPRQATVVCPG